MNMVRMSLQPQGVQNFVNHNTNNAFRIGYSVDVRQGVRLVPVGPSDAGGTGSTQ